MRVGDRVPQLRQPASDDAGGWPPFPTGGTGGCGREAAPGVCDRGRVLRATVQDGPACAAPPSHPVAVRLTCFPNLVPWWESYRIETKKSLISLLSLVSQFRHRDIIRATKTARVPESARALVRCD